MKKIIYRIIKKYIKKIIYQMTHCEFWWVFLNSVFAYAAMERMIYVQRKRSNANPNSENHLDKLVCSYRVARGPFKGMVYPESRAVGSALGPKLLGSYERELHPLIDDLMDEEYSEIINIGCAEGYYAVGFARMFENSKVYAYDVDEEARELCADMAKINGVGDRVIIGGWCDTNTLCSIPIRNKGLVVCDCEGYEKELFSREVATELENSDLLIEIHDFVDIGISDKILDDFAMTHHVTKIQSVDDIQKCRLYNYDEIRDWDLNAKKLILSENRPSLMEWFFFTPMNK